MYKYLSTKEGRYILSIGNHQEISAALADFCRKKGVKSGVVGGIAAISQATFRYLDPETKTYVDKTFDEQMEITCLAGNVSSKDGDVYL
ncbi:MAG: DNA-binding protein, partial [Bacteroidales bacterium]|nr:DNA-binding protein [Bacteroidales bacterium]